MWIPITLLAACFQILRTSEQHRIRALLTTAEAGYVRFFFAFPMAVIASAIWFAGPGELPTPGWRFLLGICGGGTAQILATVCLLESFKRRDFAIGTLYTKTEVVFVGVGSAVLVNEQLRVLEWIGVGVCLTGVLWLAAFKLSGTTQTRTLDQAAGFGILAALGFALAAIGIRAASNSLEGSTTTRALFTLTLMLGFQTVLQGSVILRSSSSSIRTILTAWRPAALVALLSLLGSASWAVALTLESAARVRTLGQIEIILAFAIGIVVHREQHNTKEYLASAVALSGIALLVLG